MNVSYHLYNNILDSHKMRIIYFNCVMFPLKNYFSANNNILPTLEEKGLQAYSKIQSSRLT